MTIVEKAAYLKGLAEGLGIDSESREGKLWAPLHELLTDMAHEIEDLQAAHLDMADALDELGEELSAVEEQVYDLDSPELFDPELDEEDEDEDDEDEGEEGEDLAEDDENEDSDEEPEDDENGEDELLELPRFDSVMYDVTCPVCGTEITLDEEMLAEGSIDCPGCGETLEFDLQDEEEET